MNSPITGKPMKLVKEAGTKLKFRKEEFEVTYHYYLCEDTNEQFTNDELDSINLIQVHNLYREKYGIPFTEEIKEIRKKYNVSASKMSEILGLGANTYRLYEEGEIPSVSNGRLILAIKDPKDFIKQVQASAHLLSEKETNKLIHAAQQVLETYKKNQWDILLNKYVFNFSQLNQYNGYTIPDLNRIAQIICYFTQSGELFRTKLNKLLFYTDFVTFSRSGYSMTGLSYRAIQRGPVPSSYQNLFAKLCEDGLISTKSVTIGDEDFEAIVGEKKFDAELFSELEVNVLKEIHEKLLNIKTNELVQLSHTESAWIKNQEKKEIISYLNCSFDLKCFSDGNGFS